LPSQKAKRSCALSLDPWRLTARTRGRSSHFGCATPITAASTISGWAIARFSSSIDDIHSPPDLMTSFVRNLHVTVAVDRGDITRERPAIGTLAFRHLVVSAQSRPPESRGRQLPCHRGGDFCCCILHRMGSLWLPRSSRRQPRPDISMLQRSGIAALMGIRDRRKPDRRTQPHLRRG